MKCNEIKDHLSAFLDEQFTSAERLYIENHLQQCQSCLEDLNQLKMIKKHLTAMPMPQLSAQFDNNLAAKIAEFEQQRPHCQTLNGHVASNVVPFKPRHKTGQKNNHKAFEQINTPSDIQISKPNVRRSSIWATAATVTFSALGLTWLALSVDTSTSSEPQIALEQNKDYIEIDTLNTINDNLESLPVLTAIDSTGDALYWSDVEIEQFDQYTQLDDGYRSFNCGSPNGERGCGLAADSLVSPLTVTKL